nr:hypothetical protein BaRGS_016726 [Batillaria attramentaria]
MEYYGSIPGYLVSGIRKDQNSGPHGRQPWVFGDVNWDTDHSIWATWINGDSIPTTASTFQPKQGDIVTFNLTQWCEGDQCDRPSVNVPWKCGLCGVPIDVTLRVRNDIVEPTFDHTQAMKSVNTQELLHLLLGAANRNDAFRFTMTHWGAELGMMVDKINGLAADWSQNRYWRILFANGTGLSVVRVCVRACVRATFPV